MKLNMDDDMKKWQPLNINYLLKKRFFWQLGDPPSSFLLVCSNYGPSLLIYLKKNMKIVASMSKIRNVKHYTDFLGLTM